MGFDSTNDPTPLRNNCDPAAPGAANIWRRPGVWMVVYVVVLVAIASVVHFRWPHGDGPVGPGTAALIIMLFGVLPARSGRWLQKAGMVPGFARRRLLSIARAVLVALVAVVALMTVTTSGDGVFGSRESTFLLSWCLGSLAWAGIDHAMAVQQHTRSPATPSPTAD